MATFFLGRLSTFLWSSSTIPEDVRFIPGNLVFRKNSTCSDETKYRLVGQNKYRRNKAPYFDRTNRPTEENTNFSARTMQREKLHLFRLNKYKYKWQSFGRVESGMVVGKHFPPKLCYISFLLL